jgi:orotate phosphoribosyltransferase
MLSVRSIADLNRAIIANLHRLDRNSFDVVVGIPRSGMIPASILATALQLPLSDVESFARGYVFERSGRLAGAGKRILLVDDTVNHGTAMANAVKRIGAGVAITRFCVFGPYRGIDGLVDIFCETVQGPRAFEWNIVKHARLNRWCFDFDGVFCRDPSKEENDDGARYLRFIDTAEPLFIPTRPIGHIVTGRLEKYRAATDAWLRRYGIQYSSMTMMPFATKQERMAHGGRGQWKAEKFSQIGAEFFIESDRKQAGIIAAASGLPVWCVKTQSLA